MNLLFVTKMDGRPWAGPSYSVPQQIKAQSEIDNVCWYNLYKKTNPPYENIYKWRECSYYKEASNDCQFSIDRLPHPFNNPDIIIFEGFNAFTNRKIVRETIKKRIPYIIIPRCELTKKAQRRHFYKKIPANILFNNNFAKNAFAIHYLTEEEARDSGEKWNKNYYVIPNGCFLSSVKKNKCLKNAIKGIYIGRLELYQKGLDLMIEAVNKVQDKLRESSFTLCIYGPNIENTADILNDRIHKYSIEDIVSVTPHVVVLNEKQEILSNADVFVMTSRFEGHPMALIEALSYGLPCLVTDGTNMRLKIEESNAGWGVNTDIEDIAKGLLRVLEEKSDFSEKSIQAKKLSERYDWKEIALLTHNELEKCCEMF